MSRRRPVSLRCNDKLAKYAEAFGWDTDIVDRQHEGLARHAHFSPEFVMLLKRRLAQQARHAGLTPNALLRAFQAATQGQTFQLAPDGLNATLAGIGIALSDQDLECVLSTIGEFPDHASVRHAPRAVDYRTFSREFLPRRVLLPRSPAFARLRTRLSAAEAARPGCLRPLHELADHKGNRGEAWEDGLWEVVEGKVGLQVGEADKEAVVGDLLVEGADVREGKRRVDVKELVRGLIAVSLLNAKVADLAQQGKELSSATQALFKHNPSHSAAPTFTSKELQQVLADVGVELDSAQQEELLSELEAGSGAQAGLVHASPCRLKCDVGVVNSKNAHAVGFSIEGGEEGHAFTLQVTDEKGASVVAKGTLPHSPSPLDLSSLHDGLLCARVSIESPAANAVPAEVSAEVQKHAQLPSGYAVRPAAVLVGRADVGNFAVQVVGGEEGWSCKCTAQDSEGGQASVTFPLRGAAPHRSPALSLDSLADGPLSLSLQVTDKHGNVGEVVRGEKEVQKNSACITGYVTVVELLGKEKAVGLLVAKQARLTVRWAGSDEERRGATFACEVVDANGDKVDAAGDLGECQVEGAVTTLAELDLSSLASGALRATAVLTNAFGNAGDPAIVEFDNVLGKAPEPPAVLHARRHGHAVELVCKCEAQQGALGVDWLVFDVKKEAAPQDVVGSGAMDIAAEGRGEEVVVSALIQPGEEGRSVVVEARAVNEAGEGPNTSVVVHPEQVVSVEMEIKGLGGKRDLGTQRQAAVRRAIAAQLQSCCRPDGVTLVCVTDALGGSKGKTAGENTDGETVVVDLEIEPSCLRAWGENKAEVAAMCDNGGDSVARLLQDEAGCEGVEWVRFRGAPKRITYARTGWLQVKVCKAVGLFKDSNEREAHLTLRIGAQERKTRNLAVFKEDEATEWNQSFEFEHITAKDQAIEVGVWSRKKNVLTCSLDMVKELYPGFTEIVFQTACASFVFECTWHPRSLADREMSAHRHVVRTVIE